MKLGPLVICSVVGVTLAALLWLGLQWTGSRVEQDELPKLTLSEPATTDEFPELDDYFRLLLVDQDPVAAQSGLENVLTKWKPTNAIMLLEMLAWLIQTQAEPVIKNALVRRLGLDAYDIDTVYRWAWSQPYDPHPQYAEFKARLYSSVDSRFVEYFDDSYEATIRLDEICFGGVQRDGIPPLHKPKMISVEEADYLEDSNVVYGIEFNGDARAYPKRVLAWHEMFKDTVGGISVCGVYCTLCGSLIVYETNVGGQHHDLGTSGFVYRSNKLMYDHATKSLWSTLKGEPVVGPLVGKGIKLKQRHVVTTTWGQWKQQHPTTTVLSLETGHDRDYSEGQAYKEYFSHDRLAFTVPREDDRLKNKAEVLVLRSPETDDQVAISADFLSKNPVFHDKLGDHPIVVLTDPGGANRVFETAGVQFVSMQDEFAIDAEGNKWSISEAFLRGPDGSELKRLPAHRAFWFGWHNVFPNTRLIK